MSVLTVLLPVLAGIALLLTTIIGIVGVRTDFREKGILNRAGRFVIGLSIAAAVVGIASVIGDALSKNAESKRSATEIANLELGLERPLMPISGFSVVYAVDVTRSSIGNGNTGCHSFPLPLSKGNFPGPWNKRWADESGIKEAMTPPDVDVEVYSKPIDPQKYKDRQFDGRDADLYFSTDTREQWNGIWQMNCGKQVGFWGRSMDPGSQTGAILSTVDLPGKQMVIIVRQADGSSNNPVHPKLNHVEVRMQGRAQSSVGGDWKSYEVATANEDSTTGRATIFSHILTDDELRKCCLPATK